MNTQKAIDLTYELENLLRNIRELDSLDGNIELTQKAKHEDYAAEIQAVKDTFVDEVEDVMRRLDETVEEPEPDLDDEANALSVKAQKALDANKTLRNYLGAKKMMDAVARQAEKDGLANLFSGKINPVQAFLDRKINICMLDVKSLVLELKS